MNLPEKKFRIGDIVNIEYDSTMYPKINMVVESYSLVYSVGGNNKRKTIPECDLNNIDIDINETDMVYWSVNLRYIDRNDNIRKYDTFETHLELNITENRNRKIDSII